jgi:thioredoxin reductase
MFRNKEVVVIGGGNTVVEEALFLTNFASHVTVVHRRDSFRAERILQDRLFKNSKISVVWDSALVEITGTSDPRKVTGVTLKNVKTGTVSAKPADGVFIAIGSFARYRTDPRPAEDEAVRLHRDGAEFDRDVDAGRLRGRGRDG